MRVVEIRVAVVDEHQSTVIITGVKSMTDIDTIGDSLLEEKDCERDLRELHLKAAQLAAKFLMLAQLLRDDPGAIVFDEQATHRSSDSVAHFGSKEVSGSEIKDLVSKIRNLEERISELRAKSK